jgi:hypothetical protein
MPVRRFRSVEAMSQPIWRTPGDPALYAAIRAVWEFGDRVQARRFPPGVHKHRSVEALDAQVDDWHRAHVASRRRMQTPADLP